MEPLSVHPAVPRSPPPLAVGAPPPLLTRFPPSPFCTSPAGVLGWRRRLGSPHFPPWREGGWVKAGAPIGTTVARIAIAAVAGGWLLWRSIAAPSCAEEVGRLTRLPNATTAVTMAAVAPPPPSRSSLPLSLPPPPSMPLSPPLPASPPLSLPLVWSLGHGGGRPVAMLSSAHPTACGGGVAAAVVHDDGVEVTAAAPAQAPAAVPTEGDAKLAEAAAFLDDIDAPLREVLWFPPPPPAEPPLLPTRAGAEVVPPPGRTADPDDGTGLPPPPPGAHAADVAAGRCVWAACAASGSGGGGGDGSGVGGCGPLAARTPPMRVAYAAHADERLAPDGYHTLPIDGSAPLPEGVAVVRLRGSSGSGGGNDGSMDGDSGGGGGGGRRAWTVGKPLCGGPTPHLVVIDDAYVGSHGEVAAADGRVTAAMNGGCCTQDWTRLAGRRLQGGGTVALGTVFVVAQPHGATYYHVLNSVLPRLLPFLPFLRAHPHILVAIPNSPPSKELAAVLRLPPHRVLPLPAGSWSHARRVLLPPPAEGNGISFHQCYTHRAAVVLASYVPRRGGVATAAAAEADAADAAAEAWMDEAAPAAAALQLPPLRDPRPAPPPPPPPSAVATGAAWLMEKAGVVTPPPSGIPTPPSPLPTLVLLQRRRSPPVAPPPADGQGGGQTVVTPPCAEQRCAVNFAVLAAVLRSRYANRLRVVVHPPSAGLVASVHRFRGSGDGAKDPNDGGGSPRGAAAIVVGAHGAGFSNVAFMQPGGAAVHVAAFPFTPFAAVAAAAGVRWVHLHEGAAWARGASGGVLNVTAVVAAVDAVVAEREGSGEDGAVGAGGREIEEREAAAEQKREPREEGEGGNDTGEEGARPTPNPAKGG